MSEARKLLIEAERIDSYRAKCKASILNELARSQCNYAPFFVSPEEAQRLRQLIYRVELLNGADIVILHSSADNGFPHTRPKAVICLPDSAVTGAKEETLSDLLRHEAMHIHQRKFPELWRDKCKAEGWTPVPTNEIPLEFRRRCRINPDTCYDTPFWAWATHHVPLPMFKNVESPRLSDVNIEWLDRRTGAIFHEPPKSFTEKYGSPSQPEHPYEIYAVKYAAAGISSHSALYNKLVTPD
jgi:hypothetical protein